MNKQLYNNIGISSMGLIFVVQEVDSLSMAKALLVMSFITHKKLLNHLADGRTNIKGLEKLIIDKTSWFSNFNRRFFDNLPMSLNAIQFLSEIELIRLESTYLTVPARVEYNTTMGIRAKKIYQAARNITTILDDSVEKLYLNLRIEL